MRTFLILLLLFSVIAVGEEIGSEPLSEIAEHYEARPSETLKSFSRFADSFRLGYLSMYRTQKMIAYKSGVPIDFGEADDSFTKCVLGRDSNAAKFARLLKDAEKSPDKMLFIWLASDFSHLCGAEMRAAIGDQYGSEPLGGVKKVQDANNISWPPIAESLRSQFRDNRAGLNALGESLRTSEYRSIFQYGDGNVAGFEGDDNAEMVELEDDKFWNDLFAAADVTSAGKYGGSIELQKHFEPAGIVDGRVFTSTYVKSDVAESSSCLPHHSETECGACVERLDANWHMTLMWFPNEWLQGFEKMDESDTERFQEMNAEMQSKLRTCLSHFLEE